MKWLEFDSSSHTSCERMCDTPQRITTRNTMLFRYSLLFFMFANIQSRKQVHKISIFSYWIFLTIWFALKVRLRFFQVTLVKNIVFCPRHIFATNGRILLKFDILVHHMSDFGQPKNILLTKRFRKVILLTSEPFSFVTVFQQTIKKTSPHDTSWDARKQWNTT